MTNPALSVEFISNFDIIVKKNALDCFHFDISSGDSILLIDKSFNKIIKTGKRIIEDLAELKCNPAIRMAARLEPLAVPNEIWCTRDSILNSSYQNTVQIPEIPDLYCKVKEKSHENNLNKSELSSKRL